MKNEVKAKYNGKVLTVAVFAYLILWVVIAPFVAVAYFDSWRMYMTVATLVVEGLIGLHALAMNLCFKWTISID